ALRSQAELGNERDESRGPKDETRTRGAASSDPGELLERVTGGRHHPGAAAAGHRHLGHVDVAARIDPDAVRREEVAGGGRVVAAAPAGVELAGPVEDTDAAARVAGLRRARAGPAPRAETQLGDVEPPARPVDEHLTGTGDIGPLAAEDAVRREELQAAVLAVGDAHGAVLVDGQAVRDVELTRAAARFAPRLLQPAVGREAVDAGVAVAVGDVEVAGRSERQVGREMEGP